MRDHPDRAACDRSCAAATVASLQMKSFSVGELKDDPTAALRAAREQPVVVLNGDGPEAMLVHFDDPSVGGSVGRQALALGLYRLGGLSLGHAARLSALSVMEFMEVASKCGIAIADGTEATLAQEVRRGEALRRSFS